MEIWHFLRVLLRRWYLVLLPIAIVGAYVAYIFVTAPPAPSSGYTTVVRFSAAQSIDAIPNRDGDFQDVWLSSELTVKALITWAQTSSFASEVRARAAANGINIGDQAIPIAADHERSVGQLFISWGDAAELEVLAQAALDVLREDSQRYFPQFGNQPAQVTVLDDIQISPVAAPIADRFEPWVQLGLAIVVGIGIAFLADYLDMTIRTQDELERLGLEILAGIPGDQL
jgi:capsular polysaccharide biosynthesis protein